MNLIVAIGNYEKLLFEMFMIILNDREYINFVYNLHVFRFECEFRVCYEYIRNLFLFQLETGLRIFSEIIFFDINLIFKYK